MTRLGSFALALVSFAVISGGCGGGSKKKKEEKPSTATAATTTTSNNNTTAPTTSGSTITGISTTSTTQPTSPTGPTTTPAPGSVTVTFSPTGAAKEIHKNLLDEMKRAKTSIDVAMFLFTSDDLADGLIAAKKRGLKVRVLMDGGTAKQIPLSEDGRLRAGGVDVKLTNTGGSASAPKFHHKYAVFDGTTVATGSYNWSVDADEFSYENSIIIRDPAVAALYAKEFDALWTTGKGGVATQGDVVFSPTGAKRLIQQKIIDEIKTAKTEIVIAMYQFTSTKVRQELEAAIKRGVKVTCLFDWDQRSVNKTTMDALKVAKADLKQVKLGGSGAHEEKFHNKFGVIDGKVVITGSFNWNVQQDEIGYENLLVIRDQAIAKKYVDTFAKVWSSATTVP